jgi:lipopolysaccharide/colanic/teichoic acid biosynthesis glycosyltransferase
VRMSPMRLKQPNPRSSRERRLNAPARQRIVEITASPSACSTTGALHEVVPEATEGTAAATEALPPASFYERSGKRLVDLVLLAVALPFACVVALPIAAWNLVAFRDPRKVFFLQQRVGHRGRIFCIYKFRTMRNVAPSELGPWSIEKDVLRTTRFGRFLRNTHLDELPQLINILKGDMHLVGPRPEMVDIHEWACAEIPGFAQRLETPPGLTGLAQISQGYTVRETGSYAQKLEIDLRYVTRPSFRQDLSIIARTIPWVLQGRGWSWLAHHRGRSTTTPNLQSVNGGDPKSATGS